ncbi:MAG: alpha-glucosidase [Planctomycetes bacterium]|nr:alpha-glucosidase [Planctomycetota bacterium]
MDPFDREKARPHGGLGVGALESLPLVAGLGIQRVEIDRATLGRAHVERVRPTLVGVGAPAAAIAQVQAPEELASAERVSQRVDFEFDGATLRVQVRFEPGTTFYGGGLAAGPLARNGRAQVFWNTDAWRYGEESPALYSSHPVVFALAPDGHVRIAIADSIRRGSLACGSDGIEFAFEREAFDLWLVSAATPADACEALGALLGRTPMPPLWALGYHQSRWSYASQAEVLALAAEFRARKVPCDALWLDIDHMDRLRAFTWDAAAFPDPAALLAALHEQRFRAVAIVDPGLATDTQYAPTASALEKHHLVLSADRKTPATGRVWPGLCHFPDFTREPTRRWWGELAARFASVGLDGLWCDMNEPAVFRSPTKTLDEDARHKGLGGGTHRRFHNLYGHLMARATREGLERARPKERAFVLTRSAHLGTARYAAQWTGDNQASWRDLAWAVPMVLNLGLSGQPFSGPDLGGFDGDPSGELFARWFELGAFLPFARGHAEKSSCRKEPWSFGPELEAAIKRQLHTRMTLLPYLYTLFHEAHVRGTPIARPMFFADPRDERLRTLDDQFLLGDALLVAPVLSAGAKKRRVVLPRAERWYRFDARAGAETADELEVEAPVGRPPLFARAGSVLALCAGGTSTEEAWASERLLFAFPDAAGRASATLYEDDFAPKPRARESRIEVTVAERELVVEVRHEGRFAPLSRPWMLALAGRRETLFDVGTLFAAGGGRMRFELASSAPASEPTPTKTASLPPAANAAAPNRAEPR